MSETQQLIKDLELLTLRKLGTRLQGHPSRGMLPGVEASTGFVYGTGHRFSRKS
jgi:transketolase N-terminal domain/subunit